MNWQIPLKAPLPEGFQGFNPHAQGLNSKFNHYERHLPHWRVPGACYLTTFRLNDSIPIPVLRAMQNEMNLWKNRLLEASVKDGGKLPAEQSLAWEEFQRSHMLKLEALLDEGHGECLLRYECHRQKTKDVLHHYEGDRSEMIAFVIMPNHVHVLCRPLAEHSLEKLTGSWKRHSSETINRVRGRRGQLWQQETFDRIIRDHEHFAQALRYIAKNPIQAKLTRDEATVWFNDAIVTANGWKGISLGP